MTQHARGAWGLAVTLLTLAQHAFAQDAAASYGAHAVVAALPAVGTVSVTSDEARRTPGALGEPVRALMSEAGVAHSAFDSGELVLWGSPMAETRVYLDGVEIPTLFHPGGLRTVVHPALIDHIALTPGAAPAAFGRGIGGVVELSSRDLTEDGAHANLSADLMDTSLAVRASAPGIAASAAARIGYLDRLAAWVTPNATQIVAVPAYADGFATTELALRATETLRLAWVGSRDQLVRGERSQDPSEERNQRTRGDVELAYLRYQRSYPDAARVFIQPSITWSDGSEDSRFGAQPLRVRLRQVRPGLRAEYQRRDGPVAVLVGVDALYSHAAAGRTGTLTLPAREGDVSVFGQVPPTDTNTDTWKTDDLSVAPFASLRVHAGRWTFVPELRLAVDALGVDRVLPNRAGVPSIGGYDLHVHPEPRAQLYVRLAPWLTLGARSGLYSQPPSAADRSAVFGNPKLPPSQAAAVAAGPSIRIADLARAELVAFYKWSDELAVRSEQPVPATAQVLVPRGQGSAYGAQLTLQQRSWHGLRSSLAYTLSRSLRRDAPGATERLFDFDQTHVLALSVSYARAGWSAAARGRLATGNPRTPVLGSYAGLRDGRAEPVFGTHNSLRLPWFFQLDLRIERVFRYAAFTWSVWLDIINVTNQVNVEAVAYDASYRHRQDISGPPTLAMLGVSASF